jgi:poly(hydroxyalkanoate) granule-associated protein
MAKKRDTMVDQAMDQAKNVREEALRYGRDAWLLGLGAFAMAGEQTSDFVHRLRDKGADFEKSDRNMLNRTYERAVDETRRVGRQVGDRVQGTVSGLLHRVGVPDRDEIQLLTRRVEQLTEKVDSLSVAR